MNMKTIFLSLALCICASLGCTQQSSNTAVQSPDGNLKITLSQPDGQLCFSVEFKGETLLEPSPIGMDFDKAFFGKDLSFKTAKVEKIVDDYTMLTGKASHIHSESNGLKLTLIDPDGLRLELHLRAFNDAVAYRWFIPRQKGMDKLAIKGEKMELNFHGNPELKAMSLGSFTSSHEALYTTKAISDYDEGLIIDMPVYLNFDNKKFMAITEANVVDFAGMMLTTKGGSIRGVLSPRLDDSGLAVTGELPRRSPWRVFEVTDRDGSLLESTVITTLADPCKEKDLSWVDPGTTTWIWWNGYQAPEKMKEGLKTGDFNTVNQLIHRYYIDFCAANNIKYHSVTGILAPSGEEICWYYNEGSHPGAPGENDDTRYLYPGYDMQSIADYAKEKGIGLRVWVHWKNLNEHMEESFEVFKKYGIRGMMIDFMDRDDEDMIAFQKRALEFAMKYHMHIQFHGASKPSGLSRTYPAEFTREGTYNYETYKGDPNYNIPERGPVLDLDMPFTRCLAGSADYHLGSFRAVKAEDFVNVFLRPVTTSTRSHSLAMYIVLESALQLLSDAPAAYVGEDGNSEEPGFDFLKTIPTTWDETKVIDAKVNNYIIIARRKGSDWYMAGIGTLEPRDFAIPLDFLSSDHAWCAAIYHDTPDSDENPNSLQKDVISVGSKDTLNVHLARSGGFAARLSPAFK